CTVTLSGHIAYITCPPIPTHVLPYTTRFRSAWPRWSRWRRSSAGIPRRPGRMPWWREADDAGEYLVDLVVLGDVVGARVAAVDRAHQVGDDRSGVQEPGSVRQRDRQGIISRVRLGPGQVGAAGWTGRRSPSSAPVTADPRRADIEVEVGMPGDLDLERRHRGAVAVGRHPGTSGRHQDEQAVHIAHGAEIIVGHSAVYLEAGSGEQLTIPRHVEGRHAHLADAGNRRRLEAVRCSLLQIPSVDELEDRTGRSLKIDAARIPSRWHLELVGTVSGEQLDTTGPQPRRGPLQLARRDVEREMVTDCAPGLFSQCERGLAHRDHDLLAAPSERKLEDISVEACRGGEISDLGADVSDPHVPRERDQVGFMS